MVRSKFGESFSGTLRRTAQVALLMAACIYTPQALSSPAGPAAKLSAAEACNALNGLILPPSAIGLLTQGATIHATKLIPASADFGEYCLVQGSITPARDGFPIYFQVNLPTEWNRRAVQFGGGGFDGNVVSGLGAFGEGHPKEKRPLAKGYATFGGDSGHSNDPNGAPLYTQNLQGGVGQNGQLTAPGQRFTMSASFAQNEDALINFGGAALKKTHDVAVEIMKKRYGQAPVKMYFSGHSQGGHEAVLVAQRYGRDYDGIYGGAPVLDVTAVQAVYIVNIQQMYKSHDSWLNSKKIELVANAELDACDSLDGIRDGVISDWKGCKFDASKLRCPDGKDSGDTCLSDEQVKTVDALHAKVDFPGPLAHGVRTHPGWPLGNELDPNEGWGPVIMNGEPPAKPAGHNADLGLAWLSSAITNDPHADWHDFSLLKYKDRITHLSEVADSLDPDLSELCGHGGKLIIWVGMSDFRITPYVGVGYYQSVVKKMGQAAADRCVAIYASPGLSHIRSSYTNDPNMMAFLAPMENWVENGIAPGNLVSETLDKAGTVTKSRPLCKNLMWPKYNGSGDPNLASSYTCVP